MSINKQENLLNGIQKWFSKNGEGSFSLFLEANTEGVTHHEILISLTVIENFDIMHFSVLMSKENI